MEIVDTTMSRRDWKKDFIYKPTGRWYYVPSARPRHRLLLVVLL